MVDDGHAARSVGPQRHPEEAGSGDGADDRRALVPPQHRIEGRRGRWGVAGRGRVAHHRGAVERDETQCIAGDEDPRADDDDVQRPIRQAGAGRGDDHAEVECAARDGGRGIGDSKGADTATAPKRRPVYDRHIGAKAGDADIDGRVERGPDRCRRQLAGTGGI